MARETTVNVMISFSTPPALLIKDVERLAYQFQIPGKIHVAGVNEFGVRYICIDQEHVRKLLTNLRSETDFCVIISKTQDRNGDHVLFANAK